MFVSSRATMATARYWLMVRRMRQAMPADRPRQDDVAAIEGGETILAVAGAPPVEKHIRERSGPSVERPASIGRISSNSV